jgi:hypothetical protein
MLAKSSSATVTGSRCQHRTAAGRQCRSLASDLSSALCPHHAETARALDFREALTCNAFEFQRAQGVNNSLGTLYNLLAEGRISPRRASVLAHISSLLLRTLPAIDYDNEHYTFGDEEPEQQEPAESAAPSATRPIAPGKEPIRQRSPQPQTQLTE